MKNIKITIVMVVALLLSVGLSAQRGRGHNNNHYQPRHYNSYPRNHISVNVGPRYGYRPGYRPYYRYSPVYRSMARPVYRSPRPFIPFGPVFGVRINVLPRGYSRVYVGSNPYYYNEGVYYRPYNQGGYEVVAPPLHALITKLPANATVTVVDGQKYYQLGGTFYQEEIDENNKLAYRVVGTDGVLNTENMIEADGPIAYESAVPALGSRYDELPASSKMQVINQQKYFQSLNGIYYKEVIEGDRVRYEVTNVQ